MKAATIELTRATRDDWIIHLARAGYSDAEIKWKMYAIHNVVVSLDTVRGIVQRGAT